MIKPKNKIGIFSKFDVSGGSEMRCIELANSIQQYTPYESNIFCEGKMSEKLKDRTKVKVHQHIFKKNTQKLYETDCLLVVNTDSKHFTTADYWMGKTDKHQTFVDLTLIKQMVFLFNYIVSPSKQLTTIEKYCPNLKIITTNSKFFYEIGKKHRDIIHIPRIVLESPINSESVKSTKLPSDKIRIGCLSKPVHDKWNEDWVQLIHNVNTIVGKEKLQWRFLGMPNSLTEKLVDFDNVECNKEFTIPVKDFLEQLDIFVYLPSFNREEAWSRSIAEALLSGCPAITINKGGSVDQIVHGNNGFLCENLDKFSEFIVFLCHNSHILNIMQKMCVKRSQYFTSENIINKLMDFIQ
jgi:glycosyltransferase involved in cell wall biosynthesis